MVGRYGDHVFEDRRLTFVLGEGEDHGVVEGVELALEKMEKEEKAEITVEPKYGYGSKGSEEHGIPPNATLQYDVEMIELKKVITLCLFVYHLLYVSQCVCHCPVDRPALLLLILLNSCNTMPRTHFKQ